MCFVLRCSALGLLAASACTLPFDEGVPGCDPASDDFDDGARGPLWPNSFADPSASTAEVGGELVISLATGRSGEAFAGYLSESFDFTNRSTRVRGVEMPNAASNAQAFFKIEIPYPDTAMLIVEHGLLRARLSVGASVEDLAMVPYDAATQRFFRLRHRDGELYWDTSSDGTHFDTLASTPLDVTSVRVGIAAGTYEAEANPGRARFDDLTIACR